MSFQTSMHALSADATKWSETSDMLDTASSAAGEMTLTLQDFTFAGGEVLAAYEEMRSFVQDYLTTGSKETDGAASALREVRRTYEGSDEGAKRSIESKWQWH